MALTRPVLYNIPAFDATVQYIVQFNSIGGSQVTGNRLVIATNNDNQTVYDEQQTTFKFEHTLPANTLTNGTYYNATLYTIDADGNQSVASNIVQFYCYTTPTLTFTNLIPNGAVTNSTYTFNFTYAQEQNEPLNYYVVNLYDAQSLLVATSGEQYSASTDVPLNLSYTVNGFADATNYAIEVNGTTVNNTVITTGRISFSVSYTSPNIYTLLELQNNCSGGYVNLKSNVAIIDGEVVPPPPVYIDDKELDLTQEGSYVVWDEGYQVNRDFTGILVGRNFTPYSTIFAFTNVQDGSTVTINWLEGYENGDNTQTLMAYAQLVANQGGTVVYNIKTAMIDIPSATDVVTIWFRRVNNIYELYLNVEEGTA